jgi:hypothetical protein
MKKYSFDLLMTHTKPQLPNRRNHRVTVSQSQIWLKADLPCTTLMKCYESFSGCVIIFWNRRYNGTNDRRERTPSSLVMARNVAV